MNEKIRKTHYRNLLAQAQDKTDTFKATINYNKLGFMCLAAIPILDEMLETTEPRFALKRAMKEFLIEAEKLSNQHYKYYESYQKVEQDGKDISTLDIYHQTAMAYDWFLNLFTNFKPNEILSLKALDERFRAQGYSYEDTTIQFKPLLK